MCSFPTTHHTYYSRTLARNLLRVRFVYYTSPSSLYIFNSDTFLRGNLKPNRLIRQLEVRLDIGFRWTDSGGWLPTDRRGGLSLVAFWLPGPRNKIVLCVLSLICKQAWRRGVARISWRLDSLRRILLSTVSLDCDLH